MRQENIKILAFSFLILPLTAVAQLGVGREDGGLPIAPVSTPSGNRELRAVMEESPVNKQLTQVTNENKYREALLIRQLKENKSELFITTKQDFKNLVMEFSKFDETINKSLSGDKSEPVVLDPCSFAPSDLTVTCNDMLYKKVSDQVTPRIEEESIFDKIKNKTQQKLIGKSPDAAPKVPEGEEQRNILISAMIESTKKNREKLESLISSGDIKEASSGHIQRIQTEFNKYKKVMFSFFDKVNQTNNFPMECYVEKNVQRFECYGNTYVLEKPYGLGENETKDHAQEQSSRNRDKYLEDSSSEEENSKMNSSTER